MSDDVKREIGEFLIEDRGGLVFETSGNAVAALESHLAERGLLDRDIASQLARARSVAANLADENAHLEQERDAALLAAEVATGTPCWRCGGAA